MSLTNNIDTIFTTFSENLWKQNDQETSFIISQQTNRCSSSTTLTLEKSVKHVQS